MFAFLFPELWWRHEAPTQHNGSWYARSEHVRVAVKWIKTLPSGSNLENVAELSCGLSTPGAPGLDGHGPIPTMPTL